MTTTSVTTVYTIPVVTPLAELETYGKAEADRLRAKLERRFERAVYANAIVPVYWRDDLKADLVMFVPAANSGARMLKVNIDGWRKYHVTTGNRNGVPFSREGLLPDDE